MKCKYCDYENPKEAVRCECCGATLATQKPIEYYQKEAKKKIKQPKEKKAKKEKRARRTAPERDNVSASGSEVKSESRAGSTLTAVLICTLYLLMIAGSVLFFTLFYSDAVVESGNSNAAVSLYDPESKTYYFLLNGELVPGCVESENDYSRVYHCPDSGASVFSVVTSSSSSSVALPQGSYVVVSEYGIKTIDFSHGTYGSTKFTGASFDFCGDGRYLMAIVSFTDRRELYCYPLDSEEVLHVGTELNVIFTDDSADVYLQETETKRILHYNCESGELTEISAENITDRKVNSKVGYISFIENGDTLCIRYTDTGETVRISAMRLYSHVLSPNGRTVAYTETEGAVFKTYLYLNGRKIFIADNIIPYSVSDDGECIYAKSPEGDSVYSVIGKGEMKALAKLAEGAYIRCVSGDAKQALIATDNGEYLSVDGNFPIGICGPYSTIEPISSCEKGFKGGIFHVSDGKTNYICRLGSDYRFEVLASGSYLNYLLMSDDKTVLFFKNSILYRIKEGTATRCENVGIASLTSGITPNGKGVYADIGGGLLYSRNGNSSVVSCADTSSGVFFGSDYIFRERDPLGTLPEKEPEETMGDGQSSSSASSSGDRTYSLYCARNGKKKLVMENIASFEVVGDALYVYVLNENSVEGEITLYDVYGGTSVDSIELLISGVVLK